MAHGPLSNVLRQLRRLTGATETGEPSDALLLERFAANREEAAFAELVRRHGPAVLGACRRVLHNAADADDAFQATFLVLARKAGSLRRGASVAGWLYGVAYRTALQALTRAARRRVHEARAGQSARADEAPADAAWRELRPVLDEELSRLPEKYRVPVVLCYLEGKTQDEAARQLGWPLGTVATRLNRARERLRARLTRRGLTLAGGLFAALLAEQAAPAAVPDLLTTSTVKAATLFAASPSTAGAALSAGAAVLAEGVLRAMMLTKVKLAVVGMLAAGMLAFGAGVLRPRGEAAQEVTNPVDPAAQQRAEAEARLRELLKQRLEVAETEYKGRREEWQAGRGEGRRGPLDLLVGATERLLTARLELAETRAERIAAHEAHLRATKELEEVAQAQVDAGRLAPQDLMQARYPRLTAEIELERAKMKK